MNAIGLELCDEGFIASFTGGETEQFIHLESDQLAYPGFVYYDGSRYICGRQAENRSRIYPRFISDRAWDQLSLRPSELTVESRTPHFSELAYHHLQHAWNLLRSTGRIDRVVFALPGNYLVGDDGDEEKIGILLGIVRDLEIPLAGLVDIAAVALADHAETTPLPEGPALHLDIHQRCALVSLFNVGSDMHRTRLTSAHIGYAHVYADLIPKLANRFLSQTAFDVTHRAESEQQFYLQVKHVLHTLKNQDEGTIEMGGMKRSRKMSVYRDVVARHLDSLTDSIVHLVERCLNDSKLSGQGSPIPLYMSERATRIPGLPEKLSPRENLAVTTGSIGAAARKAARMGLDMAVFEDLESAVITNRLNLTDEERTRPARNFSMPLGHAASGLDDHSPGEAAAEDGASPNPAEAAVELPPTHIVIAGVAHCILSEGLDIGKLVRVSVSGIVVHQDGDQLFVENLSGGPARLNHRPAEARELLRTGDVLTIGKSPESEELIIIHCLP